jgi:hypothetical protein
VDASPPPRPNRLATRRRGSGCGDRLTGRRSLGESGLNVPGAPQDALGGASHSAAVTAMKLEKIGKLELTYTEVDDGLQFSEGGLVYGILTGTMESGDLQGSLHATNLARQRPDGVFTPTLRGVLTTPEGGKVFFTMDGLSVRDPKAQPPRRIVTVGITFWTVEPKLQAWNEVFAVAEMEGRAIGQSWGIRGPLYKCIPEV